VLLRASHLCPNVPHKVVEVGLNVAVVSQARLGVLQDPLEPLDVVRVVPNGYDFNIEYRL
jgi:hypothetical protein